MSQQSSVTAGGGVETLFELPAQSVPAPSADLWPAGMLPVSGPLAARMRPRTINEVAGQAHLLRPGAPLRRLLGGGSAASGLLYGNVIGYRHHHKVPDGVLEQQYPPDALVGKLLPPEPERW